MVGSLIALICAQALTAANLPAELPRGGGVQVTALATAVIVHAETLRGGTAAGALKRTIRLGSNGVVSTEFE